MLRWIVVAIAGGALGACLPEPTFRGTDDASVVGDGGGDVPDAPSACPGVTGVTATMQPSGEVEVCGPGYRVVFGKDGAHFPVALEVGGAQLLANGRTCNDESGAGIALFPRLLVNGAPDPHLVNPQINIELAGPVVAKVAIDWAASYVCNGMQATLGTRTTYTFFVDGRIARFDRVSHPTAVDNGGGCDNVCAGGGNGPFYLTSYTTLLADATATITPNLTPLTQYTDHMDNIQGACLTTHGRQVAFGWRSQNTRVRVAEVSGTTRALAFNYDFVRDMTSIGVVSEIHPMTMIVGDGTTNTCESLRDLAEYRAGIGNQDLELNNDTSSSLGVSPDGIYGGEHPVDGSVALFPTSYPVLLEPKLSAGTIRGGWSVWIDMQGRSTSNITVTNNGTPVDNEQQVVNSDQVIFWFPQALPAGQTLTITPS